MKKIQLLISLAIIFFASSCDNTNRLDPQEKELENKISELLSKMTLEEKIGQMVQINLRGDTLDSTDRTRLKNGMIGSYLNAGNIDDKIEIQKIAVEQSRLKIPIIFGRDVIHGYRTIFPIPLAQSCSWNPELVEQAARIAATEASEQGIHWTFAPMIDIARDPRWGRIAETTGEDPFLTSSFSRAMVKGFQGTDPSATGSIAACAKHYVGYGAAEGGKDYNTTLIPDTELRNIYLPSFKSAVDEGVLTLMSAFSDLNGTPTSGNKYTLRTILRDEWKFDGFVVSDWGSVWQLIAHGTAADSKEAAQIAATAGVDMEMVTNCYVDHLAELVREGKVPEHLINQSVANILRVKFKIGLFEDPYKHLKKHEDKGIPAEHLTTAKELATQSCVLMENKNSALPLSPSIRKIAVIGPLANETYNQLGTWSVDFRREDSQTPLNSIKELLGAEKVLYAKGLETSRTMEKTGFPKAINAANQSDAVLFFAGEESILSGEAHSRAFIRLPGVQEELIHKLIKTGKPVIVIVMAGRPLVFKEALKDANAILWAWHPGTMAGPAITDLVFGKAVPSGKLTCSFPRTEGQIPVYYNHKHTGKPPVDGNYGIPTGTPLDPVGYTSNYLDCSVAPEYPFGYGLSYTTFEYSELKPDSAQIKMGENLEVSVKVTNTGKVDADEIVQLYIRDMVGRITRPVKELKGFQRVAIKSGETKEVSFTLSTDDLAYWDNEKVFKADPGQFKLFVGSSSKDLLEAKFEVVE